MDKFYALDLKVHSRKSLIKNLVRKNYEKMVLDILNIASKILKIFLVINVKYNNNGLLNISRALEQKYGNLSIIGERIDQIDLLSFEDEFSDLVSGSKFQLLVVLARWSSRY